MQARLLILMLCATVAACSWTEHSVDAGKIDKQSGAPQKKYQRKVAQDLTDALLQLDEVKYLNHAVEIPEDVQGAFPRFAIDRLRHAGHTIIAVEQPIAKFALHFQLVKTVTQRRTSYRYSLGIGNTSVERDYEQGSPDLYPQSTLRVSGSLSPVQLNDKLFSVQNSQREFVANVYYNDQFVNEHNNKTRPAQIASGTTVLEAVTAPAQRPSLVQPHVSTVVTRELLDHPSRRNPFFLGRSNFHSALANKSLIRQDVVLFGDNSMRLGQHGKQQLHNLVTRYEFSRDVVHLKGCSHGNSGQDTRSEDLAKGRVTRVAQELYVLGVAPWKIHAEGCWSSTSDNTQGHPVRGVTVAIYRSD